MVGEARGGAEAEAEDEAEGQAVKSAAVQRWSKVEASAPVAGDVPAVTASVPVAGQCPPITARVLDLLLLPAYENVDEPTCEELEKGLVSGGPIGVEGQERATPGRRR